MTRGAIPQKARLSSGSPSSALVPGEFALPLNFLTESEIRWVSHLRVVLGGPCTTEVSEVVCWQCSRAGATSHSGGRRRNPRPGLQSEKPRASLGDAHRRRGGPQPAAGGHGRGCRRRLGPRPIRKGRPTAAQHHPVSPPDGAGDCPRPSCKYVGSHVT